MDEALVKELVARILADPRFQSLLPPVQMAAAGVKTKALIVVENEAGLQALPELQRRWSACCSLQLCVAGPVHVPTATLPQISAEQAMAETAWSRILVPFCTGRQLTQIALGLTNDKLTGLIGQAILQGIAVEIGRVDFGFTERTPLAYRRLLEEYLARVAAFGVTVGSQASTLDLAVKTTAAAAPALSDLMPWSFGEPVVTAEPENRADVTYEKKLMTEKEAILIPECSILRIARATVLTPSAIDALKRQKVQVYREGARYL